MLLLRAASVLITFPIIRLSYEYLDKEVYGIWLTILSVLTWINLFDIGIGNGLKNKLTESLALRDTAKGKVIVSTSYAIIGTISLLLMLIYIFSSPWLDWGQILTGKTGSHLNGAIGFLVICYLIQFFLTSVNNVAMAHHHTVIPSLSGVTINFFILITLLLLPRNGSGSLSVMAETYGLIAVGVLLVMNIVLYVRKYRSVSPSLRSINLRYSSEIFNLSIKFFVIQVAGIIIFTTDNIMISRFLGPEEVASYQIVYKLFSLFPTLFGIVLTPLWPAFTDAYVKEEFEWIRNVIKKLHILLLGMVVAVLILIACSKEIINLWMGKDIGSNLLLHSIMGIYVVVMMWNNIFAFLLNGISKITLQMYCGIFGALINIPLSIFFVTKCDMGSAGVTLGSIIALLPSSIVTSIQTYIFLKKKNRRGGEGLLREQHKVH